MAKIIISANSRGSAGVLKSVAIKLREKKHNVSVYATGNPDEAKGFEGIDYEIISPFPEDYAALVEDMDLVVTGLFDYSSSEGHFIRAANAKGIPTIGVLDRDENYKYRLKEDPEKWPTRVATLDKKCEETIRGTYNPLLAEELIKRTRIVGWVAYDHFAQLRKSFREEDKNTLLKKIGLNSDNPQHIYFSQNIHPHTDYMKSVGWSLEKKKEIFNREFNITKATFDAASDFGINFSVKSHPGEKFSTNFTEDLVKKHGFSYLPAKSCDNEQLILSAHSITAGASTTLIEACLLDKNTGGICPDFDDISLEPFPAITLGAIPYTQTWEGIKEVLKKVTSLDESTNKELARMRKRFSVDGKASERLTNLVESLL